MALLGKTILIVEDDEDIRESLCDFFISEGCIVKGAHHGSDAFKILSESFKPDLILLDLMMPVMSGEEFALKKNSNSEFSAIPVIIMSADPQTPQKAQALQIQRFMKKPLDLGQLVQMVEETVSE